MVITYPRELPSDPKKAFLKMHAFLTNELLEDLAENVSCFMFFSFHFISTGLCTWRTPPEYVYVLHRLYTDVSLAVQTAGPLDFFHADVER